MTSSRSACGPTSEASAAKPGADPGGVRAFGRQDGTARRELGAPIGGASLLRDFFLDSLDGLDELLILLLERLAALGIFSSGEGFLLLRPSPSLQMPCCLST